LTTWLLLVQAQVVATSAAVAVLVAIVKLLALA
jgi:hypothetical protein